jgi:hypothetical protein
MPVKSKGEDDREEKLERRLAMATQSGRESLEVLDRVNRLMSAEQKIEKAFELTEMSRQIMRAGIRYANPDATEDELQALYVERLLRYQGTSIAQIRTQQNLEFHTRKA